MACDLSPQGAALEFRFPTVFSLRVNASWDEDKQTAGFSFSVHSEGADTEQMLSKLKKVHEVGGWSLKLFEDFPSSVGSRVILGFLKRSQGAADLSEVALATALLANTLLSLKGD